MRVRVLVAAVALPLVLWAILPLASSGQSSKQQELSEVQSKIAKARAKIGRKKGPDRTPTTETSPARRRIRKLKGKIGPLQGRQQFIEFARPAKRSELERLQ